MKKLIGLSILASVVLFTTACEDPKEILDNILKTSTVVVVNGYAGNQITVKAEGSVGADLVISTGDVKATGLVEKDSYTVEIISGAKNFKETVKKDESNLFCLSSSQTLLKDKGLLVNDSRTDIKLLNVSNGNLDTNNFPDIEIVMKDGSKKYLSLPQNGVLANTVSELSGDIKVNLNDVESIAGQSITKMLENSNINKKVIDKLSKVGNMDLAIVVIDSINNIKVIPLPNPKVISDLAL